MSKEFHKKPFDEGTILKLEILTKYLEEWLPVFLQQGHIRKINIFDFQCGPGSDVNGVEGSPLRIVDVIRRARPAVAGHITPINVYFNDAKKNKIKQLEATLGLHGETKTTSYIFSNQNFESCFESTMPAMMQSDVANFLFIDPTGLVRSEWIIGRLSSLKFTDFLMFVPSADVYRFNKVDEFQKFFPGISFAGSLVDASREICAYIRDKIHAVGHEYYLAQFAIRKERAERINGLIFGSRSLFGLHKFLNVAWDKSPNGEANYDLCGDILCAKQYALPFMGKVSRKVDGFHETLCGLIRSGRLKTNKDVAVYSLTNGFLPVRHAKVALQMMKEAGVLSKVPPMGFESIFKQGKIEPLVLLNCS